MKDEDWVDAIEQRQRELKTKMTVYDFGWLIVIAFWIWFVWKVSD